MKKIPWWSPKIGNNEYKILKKVLKSNYPNEGIFTREFEKKLASLLHTKHCLAVTNATSAIFLALKAAGIGYGDEVIIPDLTFIATANAVEMTGAKTILVDIDPNTLTICTSDLEKFITKKTKAIIPVHVSGRGANMAEILVIAKRNNLFVVEDAAEAFMSLKNNQFLGTIGDIGCFSLSPAKTITTGQGGFMVTNNTHLYKKLYQLKDQGRKEKGTGGNDIHYSLGFNFKFTDLQAAIGLGQLTYLNNRIKRMRKNYQLYQKNLYDVKGISLFPFDLKNNEIPQWTDAYVERRDELVLFLEKRNIDCRKFWYPIHTQAYYKKPDKFFPYSSKLSSHLLWLPSAFTLNDLEIKYVISSIKEFYQK